MSKKILFMMLSGLMLSALNLSAVNVEVTSITGSWVNPMGGSNVTFHDLDMNGTNEEIRWGRNFSDYSDISTMNSGYRFETETTPFSVAIDTPFDIGEFTHFNFPIPRGSGIDSVDLDTTVALRIDGQDVYQSGILTYNFDHTETPNTGGGCCNDLVEIVGDQLMKEMFTVGDDTYYFQLLGFVDEQGNMSNSFSTVERQTNMSILQAKIIRKGDVPIPEPSTYLFLGSMLMSVMVMKRKKTRKLTVSG